MNNHKRHKFIKESVEIKETENGERHQKVGLRKITTYKCECSAIELFHRMPWDDDLLLDLYYSDPI